MANSEIETSSNAARALGGEYQVFLSFRGPDTRHGFTDFLYHGLVDAGVRVFKDDDELRVGEVIGGNLSRAINNSMIYIPIFSRTYASSKWCLRELAHIVDNVSQSDGKKSILPIFLDVEPEDVKLKTPQYSNALREHEKKFPDEVKAWRKALAEVDEIKGWNVKRDQSQAEIVNLVVKEVLEKLELKQKSVTENLVGLDDRVKHLIELLAVNNLDVRLIGIYGMGGIGKTTLAKVVFNKLASHFGKCCSFLEDVRESMSTKDGIIQLQKKLLSNIVGSKSAEGVNDSEQGMWRIEAIFRTKKVLVVLDDVDNKEHIKKLIGDKSLYSGSRIIVTTRNTTIMQVAGFKGTIIPYEMLKMEDALALQLFCRHAFGRPFPSDDYHGFSSEIVQSTGGLPLAIEVIGSLLNQKDNAFWEETLVRLRNVPEEEIQKKLRISYDDLDEYQQQIFLDIACFLFNEKKTDAIYMWADCQFYPERGIEVLTNRCLIKILDNNKFSIHDQLKDMGRQIVRQESPSDLGKRSRLWIAQEAIEIIRTERRKKKVQALEINVQDGSIEIANEEFERLPNLRFLNLSNGTFAGNFAQCHSKLRWISWSSPCQDFRANNMYLDNLLVFKLDGNHFTDDSKAWDLIKRAHNLKVLSLTDCRGITIIPDFSKCLGLEKLTLARCYNVKRLESFIGDLRSLIKLEIVDCIGLTYLPEEVGALVQLERFSLKGCSELRVIPSSLGNLTSLIELDLSKTRIRKLPNSIGKLKSLRTLRFAIFDHREHHAWQLPNGISTLVNLEELDLSWHNVTGEIPVGIGELSSLIILNLIATGISGIPKTINKLSRLETLNLGECHSIQVLPELPKSLTCLLVESRSLLSIPNLSNLTNLVELQLCDGSKATEKSNLLPGCNLRWIWRLNSLKRLRLNLLNVPAPPELAYLSHVEDLSLHSLDLETLGQLPSSLLRLDLQFSSIRWAELPLLTNLLTLEFYRCEVEDIPLEGLPRLEKLTVDDCKRLQRLSIPSALSELRLGEVSKCSELVEIQVVGLLKSLESLRVDECESLTRISGLSYLKKQEALTILGCNVLANVEGLDELESLKSLEVRMCPSLRRLIDAFCTKIPDNCFIKIKWCGDSIKDFEMSLKDYKNEILQNTSNKVEHPFTIIFVLGVEKNSDGSEIVGGTEREIENATPGSVTYEGLVAQAKGFGFRLERIWCKAPGGDRVLLVEIKSDKQVNDDMVPLASKRGFVHLYVEGGFDSEPSTATNQVEDRKYLSSMERPFTIIFHLGVKNPSGGLESVGGIKREKENVIPDSVTYKGLIADVKGFGFRLKRMWCESLREYCELLIEIKSDEQVKGMVLLASKRRSIHLYVEGGVDSEWEGEYDDEMMEMLREEAMKTDVYSDEDVWDVSSADSDSDSASVGESETDGTSSIDDFQSEPGNAECFEATGNRRQMRDGRIGHFGNVDGGKTTSMENRKKEKDESGELANHNDVVRSSCRRCNGVEHHESSCKATVEVEDEGDLSSVKRDITVETDQIPTKTSRGSGIGCASNQRRDPAERSRGRGTASSLRNSNGSRSGRDAASTLRKGKALNSGRSISSTSQSSATLSSGRGRGLISGKGTTLSSERYTILSIGRGRGPSSRRGTTNMGASSSSGRGIASSSRSSSTLSTGKGKCSTSGKDAIVSLGRGTTKMGACLRSGADKGSSNPQSSTTLSIGRGRGSTSGKGATVNSGRGTTLILGRGATEMGASLRSGTDNGSSSAKTEPQTSSS
ncbi:disease resistance protein L6-like [Syzygium oleosum]|uniref:disease resistance protein L6-like n=1 Tax=Syzygium oleosum TaxID=219896 RepID=UPI0011D22085|nr:disease resistance protein L6-like [Syzygium oleosum]XP_056166626.1 disease resistance protein L6-like [Syzygium oleosum]